MSTLENFKTGTGLAQLVGTQVARKFGGPAGAAAASLLLGEQRWWASIADLLEKFENGTATGEDYADVFAASATILAGTGVVGQCLRWLFQLPCLKLSPLSEQGCLFGRPCTQTGTP